MEIKVICRDETVVEAGHVRDDGEIMFETTNSMVLYCALYVFSSGETVRMDMILFFVEISCKVCCFEKPRTNFSHVYVSFLKKHQSD